MKTKRRKPGSGTGNVARLFGMGRPLRSWVIKLLRRGWTLRRTMDAVRDSEFNRGGE